MSHPKPAILTLASDEETAIAPHADFAGGVVIAFTEDGTGGNDVLLGYFEDDVLSGLGGDDLIDGGRGNDTLDGGAGNDRIIGGGDTDLLLGGTGDDVLIAQTTERVIQNFDESGGGYHLLNFAGPAAQVLAEGPTGNFLRLAYASSGSTDNVVVFEPSGEGQLADISVDFDFTMAGGSRADGIGVELLPSSLYPSPGSVPVISEEPNAAGALGIGFDIFDNGGETNNAVTLHFNGSRLASVPLSTETLNLAGGSVIHASITAVRTTGGSMVTVILTKQGGSPLTIFDSVFVAGYDLTAASLAMGARTGASTANHDIDNVRVVTHDLGRDGDAGSVLNGGSGNDTLIGSGGNDTLIGGTGNDALDGRGGLDEADYRNDTSGVTIDLSTGMASGAGVGSDTLANIENTAGGNGNDDLTGNALANVLSGNAGNDVIHGGGSNDSLLPGAGTDTVFGEDGNDLIQAFASMTGADRFDGGAGFDIVTLHGDYSAGINFAATTLTAIEEIILGDGFDYTLRADDGNVAAGALLVVDGHELSLTHSLNFDGSRERDGWFLIAGGEGNDVLTGGAASDVLGGGYGNDSLVGGRGNDILVGGVGNDSLEGGIGTDLADYSDEEGSLTVDLNTGIASGSLSGVDTLIGIEDIDGGSGSDSLTGDAGDNRLNGGAGNDVLVGGRGNDTLAGGNDNDVLFGGEGDDALIGGSGSDTANYGQDTNGVIANLAGGRAEAIIGVKFVRVTIGNDTLDGIENVIGGSGRDKLTGDGHMNTLLGGGDVDRLNGAGSDDILNGGIGADILLGGAGFDRLVYAGAQDSTGANYDTLMDFNAAQDMIDLGAVDTTGIDVAVTSGSLSRTGFNGDLASAINASNLGPNQAVVFTPNAGSLAGQTFLVVDMNGIAGYQSGQDLVLLINNPAGLAGLSTDTFLGGPPVGG